MQPAKGATAMADGMIRLWSSKGPHVPGQWLAQARQRCCVLLLVLRVGTCLQNEGRLSSERLDTKEG
jgi:hypothetical protein